MSRWLPHLVIRLLLVVVLAACSPSPSTIAASGTSATSLPEVQANPTAVPAKEETTPHAAGQVTEAMLTLRSPAFNDGGDIPIRFTCDGENVSPPLEWEGIPPETGALLLVVYDADAGRDLGASTDLGFIHWLVSDVPVSVTTLAEGATGSMPALSGGIEAANDFIAAAGSSFPGGAAIRGVGYDGPCPPARHTYVFRLLALDAPLELPLSTPADVVLSAAEGHVLAVADLTGSYATAK